MDSTTLMVTVLSMVGVRLPVLIALCIGLVWVVGAPRDATRTGALVGLVLLLLSSLGGLAAGVLPMWLVSSGNFSAISGMGTILGVLHFALAMVEAIGRLVPGVVGNPESLVEESHSDGLLEYPVYTKPSSWRGHDVPEILLSGDHGKIAAWRHEQQVERTQRRRPDLLERLDVSTVAQED